MAEDSATGVLVDVKANDSVGPANESGQTLTITGVTQGAHGSVAVEARGRCATPRPRPTTSGSDSFTYTIQDNGQSGDPLVNDFKSDTGTVNVTVTEVNDPPVAANDAASVAEDSASGVLIDVRANDSKGPANETGQTLTIDSVVTPADARHRRHRVRADPVHADRGRLLRARLLHLQGVRQRHDQRRGRSQMRHRRRST